MQWSPLKHSTLIKGKKPFLPLMKIRVCHSDSTGLGEGLRLSRKVSGDLFLYLQSGKGKEEGEGRMDTWGFREPSRVKVGGWRGFSYQLFLSLCLPAWEYSRSQWEWGWATTQNRSKSWGQMVVVGGHAPRTLTCLTMIVLEIMVLWVKWQNI